MSPKSYDFSTSLRGSETAGIVSAGARPEIAISTPPEFGGDAELWSPEHLLLASLSSCFYATFRALAARKGVPFGDLACRATGTVEKTAKGLAITSIRLAVELEVESPSLFAIAHELLARAERLCIIGESLRAPITIEPVVTLALQLGEATQ
jgi:organic hydroperoxide reductase OsmC/OhrA